LISFIIRTGLARKGCLTQAVDSVLRERRVPIEIVLVENGTYGLQPWCEALQLLPNQSIKYVHLPDADRCNAGNVGLAEARGELVCFLDDDDEIYDNYCQLMLRPFEEDSAIDAVCARAHEVSTSIHSYTPFKVTGHKKYIKYDNVYSRELLWIRNFLPIQSVLFRKSLFERYGGFDPDLSVLEDWELWVRYATNHHFVAIPEVTSFYRVPHEDRKREAREDAFRDHYFKVLDKQRHVSTTVDSDSYRRLIAELLYSYKSLNLLFRLRLLNHATLCDTEQAKFAEVQDELASTSPRAAIECAQRQLQKNRTVRFLTLKEHRIKSVIRQLISTFSTSSRT
jgi:glycosyltransferase involved in cell wall biosynthesis